MAETELNRVFAHLSTPNAVAYRAVLVVFVQAKERFRLHLRPDEVWHELSAPARALIGERATLDQLLVYLVEHGNLVAAADTAEVRTVEDFYRARFLFQSSRAGEAAEAAIALFHERLEAPGELQTQALGDIRRSLAALVAHLASGLEDPALAHQTISQLFQRFDGLANQARTFIASLQRAFHLHAAPVADFLAYKDHLLDYLERFLAELAIATGEIVSALTQLAPGITALLDQAAGRTLADRLRQDGEAQRIESERWHRRWQGLRTWFIGDGDQASQAALLRRCTRAAIPDLLAALGTLHDRRLQRADRGAELRELARWFAAAPDDDQAHALYHAAFLLAPCRHLSIDQATLDAAEDHPLPGSTSWLEAPPMRIHPRLRSSGRIHTPGVRAIVLDHGLEKLALRRRLAEQAEALRTARAWIASGRASRLSDFSGLPDASFRLLLDCLGAALVHGQEGGPVHCLSEDGSLSIIAELVPGSPAGVVETPSGTLSGPDWLLTISESWQGEAEAAV